MKKNIIKIKIPKNIYIQMLRDLKREHLFASERIGFLFSRTKKVDDHNTIITFCEYKSVTDENYIKDKSVGAKINSSAIRESMQTIMDKQYGCFHVHLHSHYGIPSPSHTDLKGGVPEIIDSFYNIDANQTHGIIILSSDSIYAAIKMNGQKKLITPEQISVIGYPLKFIFPKKKMYKPDSTYSRQSFLGGNAQFIFEKIHIGIVGYGGGGSHIGQQLAHLGIKNITIFDNDKLEQSNLNRLIGGWFSDIKNATFKVDIAKRVIKKIFPSSIVKCIKDKWQNKPEQLQQCDIVIGCIDSLLGRKELEAECRRYLIPYIDIGMDVHKMEDNSFISGQIILSMPGMPCLTCMGFLTDKNISQEVAKYGEAGLQPQVVWSNGVLASSAVGVVVDIITDWSKQTERKVYLSYDGNSGIISNNVRAEYAGDCCSHYLIQQTGPPKFISL